ncbi:MAG: SpoIIE family protein phosphatase [Chitinivibrionales bacterium]
MNTDKYFVEIGCHQNAKHSQHAAGDVFISHKTTDRRIVCVLADGLGSGIKARVLSTLTATMAMRFVAEDIDMKKAASIIMSTLPVCSERKIGYSTFTIVDIRPNGDVRIVEYDNPSYAVVRRNGLATQHKQSAGIQTTNLGNRTLRFSSFTVDVGDRVVFFTDGVSQSGVGTEQFPLGWTEQEAAGYASKLVKATPRVSARDLARAMVRRATINDSNRAKDDISCAVLYFRKPRKLLVVTGPPFDAQKDGALAKMVNNFDGGTIICGGTTAQIVARELGREVTVDLSCIHPKIPPMSIMRGADLVTEGAITLSRVAELLAQGCDPEGLRPNAAVNLLDQFVNSDSIHFVVGTRINEAHQDPSLPAELDIRRNLIRRIAGTLKDKYMKETSIELI